MKLFKYLLLLLTFLMTTGCWDRTEINDLAFVMGSSLDITDNGKLLSSLQIAIPTVAGQVGQQKKFIVISGVGNSLLEVGHKIQQKSSRRLFFSHRSMIFIGEKLAKHGIKHILDYYGRDPKNRLRTYIMVAKGGKGKDVLEVQYPFESVPSEASREMQVLGAGLGVTMRDFYMASSGEGGGSVMGVIETQGEKGKENQLFKMAGAAVFKDYKLIGFLNENETTILQWITDKLKFWKTSFHLPQGYVGMHIVSTKRIMKPEIEGNKIKFHLYLEGEGSIMENNTSLDLSQPKDLDLVRKSLEKTVKKRVQILISSVQKKKKTDIFGFGQMIHQNEPKYWNKIKKDWEKRFTQTEVTVDVNLKINNTGMTNYPLHLKEELKK
jgi:spore germination protein KC